MAAKRTVRRKKDSKASLVGWVAAAVGIVLLNLAWVSLVIWGVVELILFLKRS